MTINKKSSMSYFYHSLWSIQVDLVLLFSNLHRRLHVNENNSYSALPSFSEFSEKELLKNTIQLQFLKMSLSSCENPLYLFVKCNFP